MTQDFDDRVVSAAFFLVGKRNKVNRKLTFTFCELLKLQVIIPDQRNSYIFDKNVRLHKFDNLNIWIKDSFFDTIIFFSFCRWK